MEAKSSIAILVVLLVVLGVVAYLYFGAGKSSAPPLASSPASSSKPAVAPSVLQQSLGAKIYEQSNNPLQNKLPNTNPVEHTNPVKDLYKNPFE